MCQRGYRSINLSADLHMFVCLFFYESVFKVNWVTMGCQLQYRGLYSGLTRGISGSLSYPLWSWLWMESTCSKLHSLSSLWGMFFCLCILSSFQRNKTSTLFYVLYYYFYIALIKLCSAQSYIKSCVLLLTILCISS